MFGLIFMMNRVVYRLYLVISYVSIDRGFSVATLKPHPWCILQKFVFLNTNKRLLYTLNCVIETMSKSYRNVKFSWELFWSSGALLESSIYLSIPFIPNKRSRRVIYFWQELLILLKWTWLKKCKDTFWIDFSLNIFLFPFNKIGFGIWVFPTLFRPSINCS